MRKFLVCVALLTFGRVGLAGTLEVPSVYPDIQAAIDAASPGDVVQVAAGTYTGLGNRGISFLGKAITVQGAGDPHLTIIDCESADRGFLFNSAETSESVLTGFTIRNGLQATSQGGGIRCHNASPTISRCIIENCSAYFGGGVWLSGTAAPTLVNCLLEGNYGEFAGGGAACGADNANLMNCTVLGNAAGNGSGLWCTGGTTTVTNSILWDNFHTSLFLAEGAECILNYCDIQPGDLALGLPGTGQFSGDPLFVNAGAWSGPTWIPGTDYHLKNEPELMSPCIDAGTPEGAPSTDLEGNARPQGDGVDLGVYEMPPIAGPGEPPVADPGGPYIVECECAISEGVLVPLDGTASYDPDGDEITYTWTGPFLESPVEDPMPVVTMVEGCVGSFEIELVVNDGTYDSEPAWALVIIEDTVPPELDPGPDITVEQETPEGTEVELFANVLDACDPACSVVWMLEEEEIGWEPALVWTFSPGVHVLSVSAMDSSGNVVGTQLTVTVAEMMVTVQVDIKPEDDLNVVNLGSNGVVPVGILSSPDFDASQVDPATLTLAGSGVSVRGKGSRLLSSLEDLNADGLLDLLVKVETENLDPEQFQNGVAILTGQTYEGLGIEGSDSLTIVPPE